MGLRFPYWNPEGNNAVSAGSRNYLTVQSCLKLKFKPWYELIMMLRAYFQLGVISSRILIMESLNSNSIKVADLCMCVYNWSNIQYLSLLVSILSLILFLFHIQAEKNNRVN